MNITTQGDDWETRTVASLGNVRGGKRLPKGRSLVAIPTPYPYIRVVDMHPGGIDLSDIRYVPEDVAPKIRSYRIFEDDIFISVAGTLGVVGRVPRELNGANLTENADRITDIRCDIDYLMYSLLSERIQREIDAIRTVGAQPKLALGRIKQFEVRLPRKRAQQQAIATALRDVDSLIVTLEQIISKKRAIKQGVMQQLLTGRTRLPDFSGTWSTGRLGDLGTFIKGRGIKRDEVRSSGVPCIRYGELYTTYVNYTAKTVSFVDATVAAQALSLRRGDILFAGSGETKEEIGTCVAYIGEAAAVAGGDVIVLRGGHYDPVFLGTLLNTPEVATQKARRGQGDAVVHINARSLSDLLIPTPSIEEQRAIASVLVDADHEITTLHDRLRKARAIKSGMMQQLLTGRIRLPVEEVPV